MNLREFFERQVVRNREKVYLYFQDQEIRVQGVFSHDFRSVIPAIHLAESGKYLLERMVTHRFPLEKAERAVKVAGGEIEGKDPIKIVIVP
jgi:threonine dehydrogenase-like Zn-dependent dehydrogenase